MNAHEILMERTSHAYRLAEGEDFAAWQKRARAELARLLGLPFELCDPDPEIEYTRPMDGFTETRLTFAVEENVRATAHLWVPEGVEKPPVAICLQGHSTGMHISMGRPRWPGDEATISGGDRDFAVQAVQEGFAAFSLEQRAFGERGGNPETGAPDCRHCAMEALLLGRTLLGERVWDVERSIDLIESAFPALDAGRILVMGNSGGGTTTVYAAALDERVRAAMPSCAFSGFRESIGGMLHCECNYVPGILSRFDMGDIAGLIAPRALVVVSGVSDPIFPVAAARREFEVARRCYAAAGAQDMCRHVIGPEGHRFYAALGWPAVKELMA